MTVIISYPAWSSQGFSLNSMTRTSIVLSRENVLYIKVFLVSFHDSARWGNTTGNNNEQAFKREKCQQKSFLCVGKKVFHLKISIIKHTFSIASSALDVQICDGSKLSNFKNWKIVKLQSIASSSKRLGCWGDFWWLFQLLFCKAAAGWWKSLLHCGCQVSNVSKKLKASHPCFK